MAIKYHELEVMVDTLEGFGSRFWMHGKHSLLVQSFRLARFYMKHKCWEIQRIYITNDKIDHTLESRLPCQHKVFFQEYM